MSNYDISRFLFQPAKHYTGMRMQQGRVLLDSDYNEGTAHADEDHRRTLLELIGPHGTPDVEGFLVGTVPDSTSSTALFSFLAGAPVTRLKQGDQIGSTPVYFNEGDPVKVPNYFISAGVMYVGGLRVELERPEFIALQADYLQASAKNMPNMAWDVGSGSSSGSSGSGPGNFVHVFYLHVWEQWLSAVEDDEFLEHALGGPDTSLRVRRMRRVEFSPGETGMTCADALTGVLADKFGTLASFHADTGELVSAGLLQLTFSGNEAQDTCSPCEPSAAGRYLGAENQAIRIMLTSGTTYVWAFDDAAPLYRASLTNVSSSPGGVVTVELLTLPKDEEHWPQAGRVVQILPWSAVLTNGEKVADELGVTDNTGVFCTVATPYEADTRTFTLNTANDDAAARLEALIHRWEDAFDVAHPDIDGRLSDPNTPAEPRLFYVRFWHETDSANPDVEIDTNRGTALGSTGLVPNFLSPGLPGDYWIAAVRPETPNRIIPERLMLGQGAPPLGPRHFYAPLAVVSGTTTGTSQSDPVLTVTSVSDCRRPMVPVTDMGCCTFIVGDGVNSFGQYNSVQDAIDALPDSGGHVCVRPGVYRGEISVRKSNVTIVGCGELTVLQSPDVPILSGVITVTNSNDVNVQSLKILATGQSGVALVVVNRCHLSGLQIEAVPSVDSTLKDDAALVHALLSHFTTLESATIIASRRPGLTIDASGGNSPDDLVLVRKSTITGPDPEVWTEPPSGALVSCNTSVSRFEDCQLNAYGQFGVQANTVAIQLVGVGVTAKSFSGEYPARSALDLEVVSNILIKDCVFAMSSFAPGDNSISADDAVLVLRGSGLVEDNSVTIVTGDICWGGIQLRGGSSDLTVRRNRIIGGAGHGITVGSVIWSDATGYSQRREGAGKQQLLTNGTVTGDIRDSFTLEGVEYFPHSEGSLARLTISDNTIEQMGANGISVLTLFGISDDSMASYINLEGTCRIQGNRIRSNLTSASTAVPLADNVVLPVGGATNVALASINGFPLRTRLLPYAGIVLGAEGPSEALHLEVQDNIIEENGTNATTIPVSGIVVLAGTSIAVCGNRIVRNGADTGDNDSLQPGLRAGIAVLLAGASGGCAYAIANMLSSGAEAFHPPYRYSLHVSGNRVEQSEGRALYAVGTGPFTIESNFFVSRGFNGATSSNADKYAVGDVVYVHNLGRPWESSNTTLPKPDLNGILTAAREYLEDAFQYQGSPRDLFFVGLGGHTIFNDNHVIYDWSIQSKNTNNTTVPLSYAPVVLASLDHLTAQSNQFALRLQNLPANFVAPLPNSQVPEGASYGGRPIFSHVFAAGFSVNASENRIAEGFGDCEMSLAVGAYGMFSVVGNVLTHCPLVYDGIPHNVRSNFNNNLSLIVPTGYGCDTLSASGSPIPPLINDLLRFLVEAPSSG